MMHKYYLDVHGDTYDLELGSLSKVWEIQSQPWLLSKFKANVQ